MISSSSSCHFAQLSLGEKLFKSIDYIGTLIFLHSTLFRSLYLAFTCLLFWNCSIRSEITCILSHLMVTWLSLPYQTSDRHLISLIKPLYRNTFLSWFSSFLGGLSSFPGSYPVLPGIHHAHTGSSSGNIFSFHILRVISYVIQVLPWIPLSQKGIF